MSSVYNVIIYVLLIYLVLQSVSCRGGGGGRGGGRGRGRSGRVRSVVRTNSKNSNGNGKQRHPEKYYAYHPPTGGIMYTCRRCAGPSQYPIYESTPPDYVLRYRSASNRYGNIFAGLALYNLARSTLSFHSHRRKYVATPGESCSIQVVDRNSFDETFAPCVILSTFTNQTIDEVDDDGDTKTVNRVFDITSDDANEIHNTYLNDKDDTLDITPNQDCVLWHNTTEMSSYNVVPCELLVRYAETLEEPGIPVWFWFALTTPFIITWMYSIIKRRREKKEKEEERAEAERKERKLSMV